MKRAVRTLNACILRRMQAKRTYKLVGVLALSVSKEGVPCFPPFLYPGNAQIIRQIAKIRGYGCGDCSQAGRPEDLPFSMQDKGNERV